MVQAAPGTLGSALLLLLLAVLSTAPPAVANLAQLKDLM